MMDDEYLEVKTTLGKKVNFLHPEEIGISQSGIRFTPSCGTSPTCLSWEEWERLLQIVKDERERRGW